MRTVSRSALAKSELPSFSLMVTPVKVKAGVRRTVKAPDWYCRSRFRALFTCARMSAL